jgi:hypothetical protein
LRKRHLRDEVLVIAEGATMATFNLGKIDEEVRQRRLELYDEHRRQAWEQIAKSTDNFDRNLLTLSSGALALSIAFLKDVAHENAVLMAFLIGSWILFSLCIAVTLASFQLSIAAHKLALKEYGHHYLEGVISEKQNRNKYSTAVRLCTMISGGLFLLALVCTLIFCGANLPKGGNKTMPEKKQAIVIPNGVQRGQVPMDMTPDTIPVIPPVAAEPPQPIQPAQPAQSTAAPVQSTPKDDK